MKKYAFNLMGPFSYFFCLHCFEGQVQIYQMECNIVLMYLHFQKCKQKHCTKKSYTVFSRALFCSDQSRKMTKITWYRNVKIKIYIASQQNCLLTKFQCSHFLKEIKLLFASSSTANL